MKILMIAAEVGPYATVGGLSQVLYFLPKALADLGHDVRIFTPKFGSMTLPSKKAQLRSEVEGLEVEGLTCNVRSYFDRKSRVKTYFLENREYYELRANVFGYADDHIRFCLLCKGALSWLSHQKKTGGFWPDVIHCHDWHASYFVELAKREGNYKELLKNTPVLLTVHNFRYQGNYDFAYCPPEERDDLKDPIFPLLDQRLQRQNALKRGLYWANRVNTVSPTHAKEMLTVEYAKTLFPLMKKIGGKLSGILNGLDDEEFDPRRDKGLFRRFDAKDFEVARAANKRHLQKLFGLPRREDALLLSYSGRLVAQKGVDLIVLSMERILQEYDDCQLVVMGGGDDSYREQLKRLQAKYPKQVGTYLVPNFRLPRKIFSGADVLLIPSRFEPGGIVALEALAYGAVPLVRKTGGLSDIVEDFDLDTGRGHGISFANSNPWSLYGAIVAARTIFRSKKHWRRIVKNCLEADFSWRKVSKLYEGWYKQSLVG